MSNWQIKLTGDQFDLEDLPCWFSDPALRVIEQEGRYYLTSSDFDAMEDSSAIWTHAHVLLEHMQGAAKLYRTNFQRIGLGVMISGFQGCHHSLVHIAERIVFRDKASGVVTINGKEIPEIYPHKDWATLAQHDEAVARALQLWGNGPMDWVNLYRMFEVVESDVGGQMYQAGWVTKKEIGRFTGTANSMKAIGDDARHAKPNLQPPSKPVTLEEARELIAHLVREWLASKLPSP